MKRLTNRQISSRALAIKQAWQTIHRTLAIVEGKQPIIFSDERKAELQACAVILGRAENDLWNAYEVKESAAKAGSEVQS